MKPIFSSFVEHKKLGLSERQIKSMEATLLKLPEMDSAGRSWSKKNYKNGYTSYSSISNLHEQFTVFQPLKAKLDLEVKQFVKKLGLKFTSGHLKLSTLWANLMPAHCYHAFHLHPNSIISGTFYVSLPKGTSPIRFEDPRVGLFMATPPRPILHDLHPRVGDVVLFESWMKHEVPPHQSTDLRISVSFNYDWI